MGQFVFAGNNRIFADMIKQLPDGLVYYKESNVIPIMKEITYIEFFEDFNPGEDVELYLDDVLYSTVKVLPDRTIYVKIESPRSTINFIQNGRQITETIGRKFRISTKIRGKYFRQEEYISLNLFSFFVMLAKAFNVDYLEIFKMFGNLYNKYLQDDLLYPKIGWFFDYNIPYGWSIDDYRKTLVDTFNDCNGNPLEYNLTAQFINSMTISAVREIIHAFTGQCPDIISQREVDGWILQDDNITQTWLWPDYWIGNFHFEAPGNLYLVDLNGKNLNVTIDSVTQNVVFTTTSGAADIRDQINAAFGATVCETYVPFGATLFGGIRFLNDTYIEFIGGTALANFGILAGKYGILEDADNKAIVLYSGRFENFKVNITVKNSLKQITEEAIRGFTTKDKLRHRWIDQVISVTGIIGSPTYTSGVDYNLIEDPIGSGDYYIEWLGGGSSPTIGDKYLVIYKYYIKDEIEHIVEQVKPALFAINYEYVV